jgi:Flp pilus assembly protein TadG
MNHSKFNYSYFKRFFLNNKALAAVEFALIVPVLLLLFLGGFELTRYVLIYQKISKTTGSMSDLISRSPELYEIDISNSFSAVEHLLAPYYVEAEVKVIISSIMDDGTGNRINWQRCGGGTLDVDSEVGQQGEYVALPAGFDLTLNEDTILAEVYFQYESVVGIDITSNGIIRKARYNKPRLGALTSIKNNAGVTGC